MLLKFPEQYKLSYLILNKNAFASKDYHPFITEVLKIDKKLYISMCPCYDLGIKSIRWIKLIVQNHSCINGIQLQPHKHIKTFWCNG